MKDFQRALGAFFRHQQSNQSLDPVAFDSLAPLGKHEARFRPCRPEQNGLGVTIVAELDEKLLRESDTAFLTTREFSRNTIEPFGSQRDRKSVV